ncbi:hypothetical protein FOVSG1_006092 [Fusarium oxysporum f. sp. vasinfectum]
MAFSETPNPRKNVPRAVKQTFWRIACFYILGVLVLGMAVPYDNEQLIGATKQATSRAASPFVIAVTLGGIPVFADVINGCLLVFTLSAASSDIYYASRSLYGLARDGQAPRLFAKARKNADLPYVGFLQPYGSYFSLFISLLVIMFNGYDAFIPHFKPDIFVLKYLGSVLFIFNVLWWKTIKKTSFWSALEVDLSTGRREWEETET